jgi:hypothetical protein
MTAPGLARSSEYLHSLGIMHFNWSVIDLYTDYAIWKFLGVTAGQAHLITSGLMFGRKARLLADLLKRSKDANRYRLIEAFNVMQAGKRDVITHAYMGDDVDTVTFLERKASGAFKAFVHTYTLEEFRAHSNTLLEATNKFKAALGATDQELHEFAAAALSLDLKDATSSGTPTAHK